MDREPSHRLARPAGPVGVIGVGDLGAHLSAVGHQLDRRRLVGDQSAQPGGMGGDQREPDDGSNAAVEQVAGSPPSADSRQCPSSA
jgi:hypothetical protein